MLYDCYTRFKGKCEKFYELKVSVSGSSLDSQVQSMCEPSVCFFFSSQNVRRTGLQFVWSYLRLSVDMDSPATDQQAGKLSWSTRSKCDPYIWTIQIPIV